MPGTGEKRQPLPRHKDTTRKRQLLPEAGENQRLPPSRGRTQTTRGNTTATFDFVSGLLVVLAVFGEDPQQPFAYPRRWLGRESNPRFDSPNPWPALS
jgi:hypothetical protein